jgi:hypothetical protein
MGKKIKYKLAKQAVMKALIIQQEIEKLRKE